MSIFNKTVSAGNLFNGAIDQYSRRIAIGSQHFQRTLPTFFSFFIPEVFGENRHQIKSSDSSSIDVHAAASKLRNRAIHHYRINHHSIRPFAQLTETYPARPYLLQ